MMDELLSRLNRPLLKRIIEYFPGDEPFYLVGGVIRDALLNRRSYDLDFITPGDALKIARHIADRLDAAYFPLDKKRKVARLILKPEKYTEIDRNNVGRIDFSSFQGVDLLTDLKGRDFTMNAMAAEVHQLDQLIDPLGGANDLVSKRLRACSDTSFLDDPVRILRAIRFAVDLELKISPDTLQLIRQATQKLPEVSNERLRDELFRILTQSHPSIALRLLDKLNALEPVMPEICMLKGIEQSPPHIMDVWDHTMDFIARLEDVMEVLVDKYKPDRTGNLSMGLIGLKLGRFRNKFQEHYSKELNPDRSLRGLIFLAGVYHDVGKYKSQKKAENGKIRFIEHEHIGSDLVEKRGISLRLSNAEIERLVILVKHHMRPSLLSHEKALPTRRAVYRFFRDTGEAGVDICLMSLADILSTYGTTLPQERWVQHIDVVRNLLDAWWEDGPETILPQPIINGDDLIEEFELTPGPLIGYLLESIREAQVTGEIHTREDAIKKAREIIKEK